MALFRVGPLPDEAIAAAARFHTRILPQILKELDGLPSESDLAIVFDPADHRHQGWRLAAVQGLARERRPVRVNALESSDETAIAVAAEYLSRAPGVTGQLLPVDGNGAKQVLHGDQ